MRCLRLSGTTKLTHAGLFTGLATCSHIARLELSSAVYLYCLTPGHPGAAEAVAVLHVQLPHLRQLASQCDWANRTHFPLISALGPQIETLELPATNDATLPAQLAACTRLQSLSLHSLEQACLDAALALPSLTSLTVLQLVPLDRSYAAAPCSWRSLTVSRSVQAEHLAQLPVAQLKRLNLGVEQPVISSAGADGGVTLGSHGSSAVGNSSRQFAMGRQQQLPSHGHPCPQPAAPELVMILHADKDEVMRKVRAAAAALGSVESLSWGHCIRFEWAEGAEQPHARDVSSALAAALSSLGPLAPHAPSLHLTLPQAMNAELGSDTIHALHSALGSSLRRLSLCFAHDKQHVGPGFFEALGRPAAGMAWSAQAACLPHLQKLVLESTPSLSAPAACAFGAMCASGVRSGLQLVMCPRNASDMGDLQSMARSVQACGGRVHVSVEVPAEV